MPRAFAALVALTLACPAAASAQISVDVTSAYDRLIAAADAAYRDGEDDGRAIELLREARALDASRPEAHNNLGVIGLETGDAVLARESFATLARLNRGMPTSTEAATWYARAHDGLLEAAGMMYDEGALEEARAALDELLALYPESSDGRYNLALALYELGDNDALRETARTMLEHEPLSDAGWAFLEAALIGRAEQAATVEEDASWRQRYDDVRAQVESLPLRLDDILIQGGSITGVLIGGSAPIGTEVPVRFRFHGREGAVGEAELVFAAPGSGVETSFAFDVTVRAPATGWSYTIEQ